MPLVREMELKSNKQELENSFQEACSDKDFVSLVKSLELDKLSAMKITSRLQNVLEEKKNCYHCKGTFMCKNSYNGHVVVPAKKENRIYFTYMPCKYEQQILEKNCQKERKVRMKNIDTKDKNQLHVIKWLDSFYENYDLTKTMKGLYLHGNFGSGKTFLLSALLNELEITKNVSIEIVYFPEALRSIKEDFETFGYKMQRFMTVDILLLDDIGAEKVTEWGRDEVLGTILQTRMEKNKTTFFTSNYTMKELETNLSLANNNVDKVKARRIIERVKYLTVDMELISEDRREQKDDESKN